MLGRRGIKWALAIAGLTAVVTASAALATATHQEYVAQVNPICKDAARQAKRIQNRIPKTGNALTDYLRRTSAYANLLAKTIHRISNVQPAPGEAAQVKAWLKGDRHTVKLIRSFVAAAHRGDFPKGKTLIPKIVKSQRTNAKRAGALGLRACAKKK